MEEARHRKLNNATSDYTSFLFTCGDPTISPLAIPPWFTILLREQPDCGSMHPRGPMFSSISMFDLHTPNSFDIFCCLFWGFGWGRCGGKTILAGMEEYVWSARGC